MSCKLAEGFLGALAAPIVRFALGVRRQNVLTNLYSVCCNKPRQLGSVNCKSALGISGLSRI